MQVETKGRRKTEKENECHKKQTFIKTRGKWTERKYIIAINKKKFKTGKGMWERKL